MIGRSLGRYEIVRQLGEGGMGVVYAARDTELERDVAIKVLPDELADKYEARAARFEREAKAIAALAHPNICTLYDVGHDDGVHYLVMELIDGESLADRLTRGPLPLDQVLRYGAEIADALDRAHRKGIVHRDLKPANVMLTKTGAKLLDFGIAQVRIASPEELRNLSTSPEPLTGDGEILGTFRYMAPEQLEGKQADARTDIFALGVVLYEMATGTSAFEGDSRASLIAAILSGEPRPVRELQPLTPAVLEHVIRKCLEKDPDDRWQSARDVAAELRWVPDSISRAEGGGAQVSQARRWQLPAAAVLVIALIGISALWQTRERESSTTVQSHLTKVPRLVQLTWEAGYETQPDISPDGTMFVYVNQPTGLPDFYASPDKDIYLRRVGGENAINLTKDYPGNDREPAFSPDGSTIAFRSTRQGGGIFLMGATGESVRRLTDFGAFPSWSPDGRSIAFSDETFQQPKKNGLWVVDVATGAVRELMDGQVSRKTWSPSGTRIAFRTTSRGGSRICSIGSTGGEPVCILSGPNRQSLGSVDWARDGLWVWSATGGPTSLWRIKVNEETGRAAGQAELMYRGINRTDLGGSSVSVDGRKVLFTDISDKLTTLRYEFDPLRRKVTSKPTTVMETSRGVFDLGGPSPDGQWLAASLVDWDYDWDIVLVRTDTGETVRLTSGPPRESFPVWSRDGTRLFFIVREGGPNAVWSIRADGSGRELVFTSTPGSDVEKMTPSPDGNNLYVSLGEHLSPHVIDLRLPRSERRTTPLPHMADGRWIQPGGGSRWSPDGKLLTGFATDESRKSSPQLYGYAPDSGTYTFVGELPSVTSYRWLPDFRHILFAEQNELKLLDRETGRISSAGAIENPSSSVSAMNRWLSSDGRWYYADFAESRQDIWMLDFGDMVPGPGNETFTESSP